MRVEGLRSSIARPAWASYQPLLDALSEQIRTAIGDEEYEVAREEGATWDAAAGLDHMLAAVSTVAAVS